MKLERVIVETWGPFGAFVMYILLDGRTVIVPGTPIVTNSGDAKRKARLAEQNRDRQKAHRQRGKTKHRFNGSPDKEVYRSPKLRKSEIAKVVSEWDLEPSADQFLSYTELRAWEGRALAEVVRWALKQRRAGRLKNKP